MSRVTTKTEPKTVVFLGKRYRIAGLGGDVSRDNPPINLELRPAHGQWGAETDGPLWDLLGYGVFEADTAQGAATALEDALIADLRTHAALLGYEVDG